MKHPAWRLAILFLFLTGWLFGPALARRDVILGAPEHNDLVRQFARFHRCYQRALAGGEWPLWNPYIVAGMPSAMFGQTGLFYPPNWLTLAAPSPDAMDLQLALHFLWALAATYWIARRLGLGAPAAYVTSVCYALSGATVGRLMEGHLTIYQALAWFPLAWGAFYRVLGEKRERKDWVAATGALTAMGLAGAPQIWLLALLALAFTALFHALLHPVGDACFARSRWRGRAWRVPTALGRMMGVAALAALLSAAEWVPVVAAGPYTARAQLAPEFAASDLNLPAAQLLSIPFPNLFRGQTGETTASVGIVALILALSCAFAFHDRTLKRVTLGIGILTLWLALGTQAGLYPMIQTVFPPLRMAPAASRFLFAFAWALSLGAGLGIDGLSKNPARPKSFALAAAICASLAATLIGLEIFALILRGGSSWKETMDASATLRGVAILGGFVAVLALSMVFKPPAKQMAFTGAMLVLVDLISFQSRHFGLAPVAPLIPFPHEIESVLAGDKDGARVMNLVPEFINYSLTAGYEDVNGYGVTMPADFARAAAWLSGKAPVAEHWAHFRRPSDAFCQWFAVKYLVACASDNPGADRWIEVAGDEGARLWRLREPFARAQVCRRVCSVSREMAEQTLHSVDWSAPGALFVEGLPEEFSLPQTSLAASGSSDTVALIEKTVNRRVWEANLAEPGWLEIHETWLPGWRVRVDGRGERLYRAQFCLCAVPLPAGKHTVELNYRPAAFFWGIAISALTFAAVAVVWGLRRPRSKPVGHACQA